MPQIRRPIPRHPIFRCAIFISIALMTYDQLFFRYYEVVAIGATVRVMDGVLALIIGAYLLDRLTSGPLPPGRLTETRPVLWSLAFFVVVGLIALGRGFYMDGTYAIGMARFTLGGAILVPVFYRSNLDLKAFGKMFAVGVFIMTVAWTLRFMPDLPRIFASMPNRVYSGVESQSAFVFASITVVLFAISLAKKLSSNVGRPIVACSAVVAAFSTLFIFLAQHRSVWVAMLVGLASICWSVVQNERRNGGDVSKMSLVASFLTLSIIGMIVASGSPIADTAAGRLEFISQGYEVDGTGRWRVQGWEQTINSTLETNPLFGKGFRRQESWQTQHGQTVRVWVHNEYIHYFGIGGLIGILAYILLIITAIRAAGRLERRAPQDLRMPFAAVKAVLLMSSAYMIFYNLSISFWIAIATIVALDRMSWASEKTRTAIVR